MGTTVKINPSGLKGYPGLRVGVVPANQGGSDAIRKDDTRNLVICPMPYDGRGFPTPRPAARTVARYLADRRERFPYSEEDGSDAVATHLAMVQGIVNAFTDIRLPSAHRIVYGVLEADPSVAVPGTTEAWEVVSWTGPVRRHVRHRSNNIGPCTPPHIRGNLTRSAAFLSGRKQPRPWMRTGACVVVSRLDD